MTLPACLPQTPLMRVLWTFRREFLVAGLFSLVINLLMLTPTVYMLQIYDRAMLSHNTMTLLAVSLLALFFFAVIGFSEWLRGRLLSRTGLRFDDLLSTRVFNAGFSAALDSAGGKPEEAFADLRNVRQFLSGQGLFACFDLPWTPIYLIVAWLLHPVVGLLSLLFALVSASLAWWGHRQLRAASEDAQTSNRRALTFLQEKLGHGEVIDAMGMLDGLRQRWLQLSRQAWGEHAVAADRSHRVQSLGKFVRYLQQSLMLAAGAVLVVHGELSAGGMIAANVLMSRILQPVETVLGQWTGLLAAWNSLRRLDTVLEPPAATPLEAGPVVPTGRYRLDNFVARTAGRETPILSGLSVELPAGSVILLIGPSGSGKSTLARCLLGLWPDTAGELCLDERPIADWARLSLGAAVGYLPQDVELMDGSIAENIARFGEIDAEQVVAAAQQAGVHEMVLRLPNGYDTRIGEAGHVLSAGQRQRIALARALYGDPALLVLDEPNANLDEAGEAALARVLRARHRAQKTVFLISHRLLALDAIDWVLVLVDGQITRQGPPAGVFDGLLKPAATGAAVRAGLATA